jgi:hypothetical protein
VTANANAFTLSPRDAPWFPPLPTQAELRAIDRCHALAKDAGVLDRLRDLRALLQQINEEPRS